MKDPFIHGQDVQDACPVSTPTTGEDRTAPDLWPVHDRDRTDHPAILLPPLPTAVGPPRRRNRNSSEPKDIHPCQFARWSAAGFCRNLQASTLQRRGAIEARLKSSIRHCAGWSASSTTAAVNEVLPASFRSQQATRNRSFCQIVVVRARRSSRLHPAGRVRSASLGRIPWKVCSLPTTNASYAEVS